MLRSFTTRRVLAFAAIALAVVALPQAASAQKYPERPVRLVLPLGAAGVGDITARIIAERLGDKLGQRFVVENMPGPGGIVAGRAVLSAPADGYTLLLMTGGIASSVPLYNKFPLDMTRPRCPTCRPPSEKGVKGFEAASWNAVYAKAGTPPQILATLNKAMQEVLAEPDVKKRLLDLGIDSKASTPAEMDAQMRGDITKWTEVIDRAGIEKR
jgi:tripartite-type tricarboxylate transporter receptor subunit TctC